MKKIFGLSLVFITLILINGCSIFFPIEKEKELTLEESLELFERSFEKSDAPFEIPLYTRIDTILVDTVKKDILIKTNKRFSYRAFRENDISEIKNGIKEMLGNSAVGYNISVESMDIPIENLIPNIYRSSRELIDKRRMPGNAERPKPVVQNTSRPFRVKKGMFGKNIGLWHSHGWYYNHNLDRWLWQRARLFQMVEDIGPMSLTVPYLIPMLENAGANVFVPRERDLQTNEVVVDNDSNAEELFFYSSDSDNVWKSGSGEAFAVGNPPYPANFNPFMQGSHEVIRSSRQNNASAEYIPNIPEQGEYSVYISYQSFDNSCSEVSYSVYHTGGKTDFKINQQIGGGTWIFLGTFKFNEGINPDIGKVVLRNESEDEEKIISADAVRFGGGMGIVSRNGRTSGRPKFAEGSRYWLQYAGMPDTLVYNINNDSLDYTDDYQSRAEYLNFLTGSPNGPNKDRDVKGLGIPIDLSLAFHTDAGITNNDTVIGTLVIYSLEDWDSNRVFPSGMSRLANRDLSDILQTELINDIKAKYDPVWRRRQLMNAMYSEAFRPNMPAVLLELLSHQNFLDVKFMLDPRFRFDVSRSMYKAFLKFLAFQNDEEYVVQPLPVDHFAMEFENRNRLKLTWNPVPDPLEPTAIPDKYMLYTRKGRDGFDNGILLESNEYSVEIDDGVIYSFKVTAINDGGESFPSEILSAFRAKNESDPLLIINAFDRVSAPASVQTDEFTGFLDFVDAGVPDKYDLSYTGRQHNFNPTSKWATDDIPGHGASYADFETKILAGNTFDFPNIHGHAMALNGYSFTSVSDESVWSGNVDLLQYSFVDIILGEEKTTPWQKNWADSVNGLQFTAFPNDFQKKIEGYLNQGGNIFISGSYVGSDLYLKKAGPDSVDINFAEKTLRFKLASDHAVQKGEVISIKEEFLPKGFKFNFNTDLSGEIYAAEAPDAVRPMNGGEIILRYAENLYPAATAYRGEYGAVIFGFPFETVLSSENKVLVMRAVLKYLGI